MSALGRTPILDYEPGGGVPVGTPPEIVGDDVSGILVLAVGQPYLDVTFPEEQNNPDWQFIELRVVNLGDPYPLNIFPGLVTAKSITGFRIWFNGNPDTANYWLYW